MTLRRLILAALAMIVLGAAAYWGPGALRPAVAVVPAERGIAVQAVYATGVVEPVTWARVSPLVRARIVDVCACEGMTVARGDELARLDDAEPSAILAELEARETFLAGEAARYRNLLERGVVSTQAYERATSELLQIRAEIRAQRTRLDNYTLRAPIDGTVLRRDGEIGEIVGPDNIVFWVGQPQPLWIVAEVDEEDIPLVAPGKPVLIDANAFPDHSLPGTVTQITPKGDPLNKSFRVRIALPGDTPLMIGMTVEVNVIVREVDDAVLVPATALVGDTVFVVAGERVSARTVAPGIRGGTRIEIRDGLTAGERIVADPPPGLRDGERVRIDAAGG